MGRLSPRCSNVRFNCESATTGTDNSLASALSEREISETSVARFSLVPGMPPLLPVQAPRPRPQFVWTQTGAVINKQPRRRQHIHR